MNSLTKDNIPYDVSLYAVNGNELVATVVYVAISCKTYPTLPRKLDVIIDKVTQLYKTTFEKVSDSFYIRYFTNYSELSMWLRNNIQTIPEIRELNLSQAEFDASVDVDNADRRGFVAGGRGLPTIPENDDFIDLDALTQNITQHLIQNNININFSTFN